VRAHAFDIDTRDLHMLRDHRNETRGSELNRFLNHVVEPLMLQRREKIMQVAGRRLRARLFQYFKSQIAPASFRECCSPFAVPAIEHQDLIASLKTEHIAEIISLRLNKR